MEDVKKIIVIGCDYVGYLYKDCVIVFLELEGWMVWDFGMDLLDFVDYFDFVYLIVDMVELGEV